MNPDDATQVRATALRPAAEARFTPGAIVAERYRIVSLLGGGGMGEVYRADDLKLGQRVALKYVLARDSASLERLYAEVRIGRQIAHPNVCRLYDLVEVGGQHFITMEYVDGEDLASLLRRIGRLPADKALALASDLCAGLAASHDRGFIHRDLKPANVMIDGRGNARITDLGLAGLADETTSIGGTPLYMAPEQLEQGTATPRSDLYALGLVLYEMFTGRRVFDALTVTDLRAQHAMAKTRPASLVHEIDPAVERVILRCLEEDPAMRPASAHEVLLALPGSDPLRAAVAAGETPSPEMVAAAGKSGDLSVSRGWTLLVLALVLLACMTVLRQRSTVLVRMSEVKSPEALSDRARGILRDLGFERAPHSAGMFVSNRRYVARETRQRRATLGPAAAPYVYRESPRPFAPFNEYGLVLANDPPLTTPGMATVIVDAEGKLRELRRVPPELAPKTSVAPKWEVAFARAGLDSARFRAAAPERNPPVGSDRRFAWTSDGVRVEAASAPGQPVWFVVLDPDPVPLPAVARGIGSAPATVIASTLILAAFLARRNVVRGRADGRGAVRVAIFGALTSFGGWILVARHHTNPSDEWSLITVTGGAALFFGLTAWFCYLAIEPAIRRRWPHMLIGWTRVVSGRLRDPLVGRELLVGVLGGAAAVVLNAAVFLLQRGFVPINPLPLWPMLSRAGVAAALFRGASIAVIYGLGITTIVVLCRVVLRKPALAWAAAAVVTTVGGVNNFSISSLGQSFAAVVAVLAVLRIGGLLSCVTALFCFYVARWTPLTFAPDDWWFARSSLTLLAFAAIAVYGFRTALAGKPLLGRIALEDEAPA